MIGKVVAAQFDLERAIAELTRAGLNTSELRSQIGFLTQLQQTIGSADLRSLAGLSAQIAGAVDAARQLADESRQKADGASASTTSPAYQLAAANAAVAKAEADYYDRRVLDPYLRFSSAQDEEEYRKREAENRAAYEREHAKGTPEGDANAARIMERQLLDAGAHGADASPDYAGMLSSVRDARVTLASAAAKTPQPDKAAPKKLADGDMGEAMAALRDAGVVTNEAPKAQPDHGLTDRVVASRNVAGAIRNG